MKNVYVCLSLNDAIYHEMLYQQMRMSTYVKSNAYMVLKSSTTDRCTIVSFLTSRQYAMSSNGFMLVLNPCIWNRSVLLHCYNSTGENHIFLWVSTIRIMLIAAFILPILLIHINQLSKKCWPR